MVEDTAHRQRYQKCSCPARFFVQQLTQRQLLLILDIQEGLFSMARDFDATLYRDSMIAHSAIGQVFDIPVVMTTSAQQGQISHPLHFLGGLDSLADSPKQVPMALCPRKSWTCTPMHH